MLEAYAWHIAQREERSEWEAAYIAGVIRWAEVKTGGAYRKILDVPCGNARLHPFLKAFGFDVYGFDKSEELVSEGKRRNPHVWVGDMRDPEVYRGTYDVVLNWYTSFGYFSDEENEQVLRNFARALRPGGIVIIDIPNAKTAGSFQGFMRWDERIVEVMEETPVENGRKTVWIRIFEDFGDRMELRREVKVNLRLYTIDEVRKLLERAGFRLLFALKDYTFRPADDNTRRVLYVGVKE